MALVRRWVKTRLVQVTWRCCLWPQTVQVGRRNKLRHRIQIRGLLLVQGVRDLVTIRLKVSRCRSKLCRHLIVLDFPSTMETMQKNNKKIVLEEARWKAIADFGPDHCGFVLIDSSIATLYVLETCRDMDSYH